jgi:hypothetical protein
MREADQTLWPVADRGGGKGAAHIESHHLVNLALALAVADPIAAAPDVVAVYRALISHQPRKLAGVWVGAADLGGWLEELLELLADPDNGAAGVLLARGFHLDLIRDLRMPRANIVTGGEKLTFAPPMQSVLSPAHASPIVLTATLPLSLFTALADMCRTLRAGFDTGYPCPYPLPGAPRALRYLGG